ncbi:MAG: hypothetical protein P1P88_05330 [Bacteroidales bacterium]|nr:hypothetical protein [Bacteroidales bacterium]
MINSKNTKLPSLLIGNESFAGKSINNFLKKERKSEIPSIPTELKGIISFKNKKIPILGIEPKLPENLSLLSKLMMNKRD